MHIYRRQMMQDVVVVSRKKTTVGYSGFYPATKGVEYSRALCHEESSLTHSPQCFIIAILPARKRNIPPLTAEI